jgi:hypothetical protein
MSAAGTCLCGAVSVSVSGELPATASACHCRMCQIWSGAAFWGIVVPKDTVQVEGPVKLYNSSSFAERAFCADCGTHLWFRDFGADYEFVPGLFAVAHDITLDREVYADRAMACVDLAGSHTRISRAEYESNNLFVEGDTP